MNNEVLKGKRAYMSGPIEFGDSAINWRVGPKKILSEEFGVNVFDPFDDPKQQWSPKLVAAQKEKDYATMVDIATQFVRKDLCVVDRSDFLIAYLPHKVPTTGTVHEIINSSNAKKPTLLITNCEDISYIPLWYYGFIPKEFMFAGWDNLFSYLREVNEGLHKHNKKWDFIYGLI